MNKFFRLYIDGIKNMPQWGRTVWIIIFIKLLIFFVVMKLLFFPNILNRYHNDKDKSDYVIENICQPKE